MGVYWVALFKAFIGFSISKCRGLKCPPPPLVMWAIFVGSFRLISWGLKCLPPYLGQFSKCLSPFVGMGYLIGV